MKIVVCIDCDSDPVTQNCALEAFRIVDWPYVPRCGEKVTPMITSDQDFTIECVHHDFKRECIILTLEPVTSALLNELLREEMAHWLISTQAHYIDENEAVSQLRTAQ